MKKMNRNEMSRVNGGYVLLLGVALGIAVGKAICKPVNKLLKTGNAAYC